MNALRPWGYALPASMPAFLVCLGAAFGSHAAAQTARSEPNGFTWGELAILPPYCKDTQGTVYGGPGGQMSPDAPKWLALMGNDFWHMHHYCYGLRDVMHADAAGVTPIQSRRFLEGSINQYMYIVHNAQSSMPLMPEVYFKIGQSQLRLGNLPAASEAFEMSRRLKPDYWPAYTTWIDELLKLKQTRQAKELALEGLAQAPNSSELLARMRRIDPKFVAKPAPRPSPKAASSAAPASAPDSPRSTPADKPSSTTQ